MKRSDIQIDSTAWKSSRIHTHLYTETDSLCRHLKNVFALLLSKKNRLNSNFVSRGTKGYRLALNIILALLLIDT